MRIPSNPRALTRSKLHYRHSTRHHRRLYRYLPRDGGRFFGVCWEVSRRETKLVHQADAIHLSDTENIKTLARQRPLSNNYRITIKPGDVPCVSLGCASRHLNLPPQQLLSSPVGSAPRDSLAWPPSTHNHIGGSCRPGPNSLPPIEQTPAEYRPN